MSQVFYLVSSILFTCEEKFQKNHALTPILV